MRLAPDPIPGSTTIACVVRSNQSPIRSVQALSTNHTHPYSQQVPPKPTIQNTGFHGGLQVGPSQAPNREHENTRFHLERRARRRRACSCRRTPTAFWPIPKANRLPPNAPHFSAGYFK